ncbi:MAG TPA: hypothetical protein PKN70_11900 [Smithellaceae bacterium]|nr:hypothetical protein [Smithellaceae bacterium]
MAEKKKRNPWTPEARARHAAGVKRYHEEKKMFKLLYDLYFALKPFAKQHGLDFENTLDVYVRSVNSLQAIATGKAHLIDENFQESFLELIKKKQAA